MDRVVKDIANFIMIDGGAESMLICLDLKDIMNAEFAEENITQKVFASPVMVDDLIEFKIGIQHQELSEQDVKKKDV